MWLLREAMQPIKCPLLDSRRGNGFLISQRTSAEAEGYRIERSLMDCRGGGDAIHQCRRADSRLLRGFVYFDLTHLVEVGRTRCCDVQIVRNGLMPRCRNSGEVGACRAHKHKERVPCGLVMELNTDINKERQCLSTSVSITCAGGARAITRAR